MPSNTAGGLTGPTRPMTISSSTPAVHYRPHQDPRSSHQQIFRLVRKAARDGFAPVLDVGCAQGMLGQMLAEDGTKLDIDGVEMNPAWSEMARPFYRNVWTSTIEEA